MYFTTLFQLFGTVFATHEICAAGPEFISINLWQITELNVFRSEQKAKRAECSYNKEIQS